ncbi:MAG: hypothetical protein EOQ83_29685 [Mesorhizobium sp.]|nr:MAG: hypothetical protein EOQ83_29685 [Mesorhizobium sp.]
MAAQDSATSDEASMSLPSAMHLLNMRQEFALDADPENRKWQYFLKGTNSATIQPSRLPSVLFRGQNARFIPCRSALGRNLTQIPKPQIVDLPLRSLALLVSRLVKRLWFREALQDHPGTRWLKQQQLEGFECKRVADAVQRW